MNISVGTGHTNPTPGGNSHGGGVGGNISENFTVGTGQTNRT